jgi:hypothetical protein
MRRVLSTVLAVALLLGLGALAVLALPNASASLAEVPAVSAAAPEFNPDAVNGPAFNLIAMPLNAATQFTSKGYTFTGKGLMLLGGADVLQVNHWQQDVERYESITWDVDLGVPVGTDFDLQVGQAYWVVLGPGASNLISFVGDVPAEGTPQFPLTRGDPCKFNELSIPLNQSAVNTAAKLMTATGAQQVSRWVASSQLFESLTFDVDLGYPTGIDFPVQIGYPYVLCLLPGTPTQWP